METVNAGLALYLTLFFHQMLVSNTQEMLIALTHIQYQIAVMHNLQ